MFITKEVTINGHSVQLALPDSLWDAVNDVCSMEHIGVHDFLSLVDRMRGLLDLGSALHFTTKRYLFLAAQRVAAAQKADKTADKKPEK